MNCIIIEDEPLASERAKDYVQKLPFLNLLALFDNAFDVLPFFTDKVKRSLGFINAGLLLESFVKGISRSEL